MKVGKLILAAFAVTLMAAFGTMASASAAEVDLLPAGTEREPVSFTGKSEAGTEPELKAEGVGSIKCTSAPAEGSGTSGFLWLVFIEFRGCHVPVFGNCTGLSGEAEGVIRLHAEVHLRRGWLLNREGRRVEHPAVWEFLILHVHFTCPFVGLILVLGCAAALANPRGRLSRTLEVTFAESQRSANLNDIQEVENGEGRVESCGLKTSVEEGAEHNSVEIAKGTVENFKQNGREVEALIMA